MKKKILCGALLGALGFVQAVSANETFDDRWYVTAGIGYGMFDSSRQVKDNYTGHLSVGRFVAPRWSWDAEIFYANPEKNAAELNWSQYSLALVSRYHLRDEADTWWPYFAFGMGLTRAEEEFAARDNRGPVDRKDNNLLAIVGTGLQADFGRLGARAEVGYRFDFDDQSSSRRDYFSDPIASISLVVKLGEPPAQASAPDPLPPPPPEPVISCADLDDDGDGVNNCDDKCPNSLPGQAVGPDGCPVPLTIDLRGVNFDFDKATLRPDAIAILDEAIGILSKYPEIRVEVAGHTDSIGSEQYNQGLSERRARTVYDYLTSKGISASRLAGPNGYGESRPIAPNTTPDGRDNPEGRAQNRPTELNVQN